MTLDSQSSRVLSMVASVIITTVAIAAPASGEAPAECDYWAGPTVGNAEGLLGTPANAPSNPGDGSRSNPFVIADFWGIVDSNDPTKDTLCLLDGTYLGDDQMIVPPHGDIDGHSDDPIDGWNLRHPITIRAENDGQVLIDGENARAPVRLVGNSHFDLQGFNARNAGAATARAAANAAVVVIKGQALDTDDAYEPGSASEFVRVQRVVAWDAGGGYLEYVEVDPDGEEKEYGNSHVFAIEYTRDVLLEDIAGFGLGRKIVQIFVSERVTVRRAWGRWEGNTWGTSGTPKMTFSCT